MSLSLPLGVGEDLRATPDVSAEDQRNLCVLVWEVDFPGSMDLLSGIRVVVAATFYSRSWASLLSETKDSRVASRPVVTLEDYH